jgi:leucyl/phenylalanyl-tRNA--protein transferase
VHSVEVFHGRQLVAGEIGYTCGTAYTSLSGFHRLSGAGSVQLGCLGRALAGSGFSFWDLGMEIEYKLRLGARLLARDPFLASYRAAGSRATLELSIDADCAELLDEGYRRRLDRHAP